ncbi:hypothetical protein EB796_007196 [Bugula neritina]|uniref:Uncharacterized protein n=1 Tax=Bugula neritina TaxID=10212 RepID=A0A7J7K8G5_BUGNE|nr:hypothetical protein EB796_007196 [Bugula neritina]
MFGNRVFTISNCKFRPTASWGVTKEDHPILHKHHSTLGHFQCSINFYACASKSSKALSNICQTVHRLVALIELYLVSHTI